MISAWLPYYQENFQLSQTQAGLYATAYLYPVSIVGAILAGVITDKWSVRNKYARVLVQIIGLCRPCVFGKLHLHYYLGYSLLMVYGFMRMTVDDNLMPIMCLFVENRYRATAYGV